MSKQFSDCCCSLPERRTPPSPPLRGGFRALFARRIGNTVRGVGFGLRSDLHRSGQCHVFTSFAVTWTGARLFDDRKPQFVPRSPAQHSGSSPAVSRALTAFLDLRVLLSSGIISAYTGAAAFEFWRGRSEPLVSRWPAIFMLFAHGALYLLRTPLGDLLPGSRVTIRCWVQRLAQFRSAVVHDLDRLHPVGDGEGAGGAAPQDRGDDRSVDRYFQSPRLPARRRAPRNRRTIRTRPR